MELTGRESQGIGRGNPLCDRSTYKGHTELVPTSVNQWGYELTTPLWYRQTESHLASALTFKLWIIYSRPTLTLNLFLSLLHHNYLFFSLCVFPALFSAAVINSNTPSLNCQSKLHRDLRRTIVCLYAQSINLNYKLSHYMPTIKQ